MIETYKSVIYYIDETKKNQDFYTDISSKYNKHFLYKCQDITLFNILEKIYNYLFVKNQLYIYQNIRIYLTIIKSQKNNRNKIKDEIMKFQSIYSKLSIKEYGVNALDYILQSIYKLYIDKNNFDINDLQYILCPDCKLEYLYLKTYKNIRFLEQFLITNKTLKYLHICITHEDIPILCKALTQNDELLTLDLSYSKVISYDDIIQIINRIPYIQNLFVNNIIIKENSTNLDQLFRALMNNTNIVNFNMSNVNNFERIIGRYYPFDKTLTELIEKNHTLNYLNLYNVADLIGCFNSYYDSILQGLKTNTSLIDFNIGDDIYCSRYNKKVSSSH